LLLKFAIFSKVAIIIKKKRNSKKHMNCEICKRKIGTTFLKKILGTYIKDSKGKKRVVCFECQKKFSEKALILQQLK
tara:strand:+ start:13640 stop:13870 length:231 start_codon:yes stop_codon:yes gene_type:complete